MSKKETNEVKGNILYAIVFLIVILISIPLLVIMYIGKGIIYILKLISNLVLYLVKFIV